MRFRRGPRKASEIQKKNLVENAKDLAEDPMKVIPECGDSCLFCKFGRAKRKIKKIKKYVDDEKKLEKYAKRGPDLSKAVAGTILFGIQEEAKKVTTAKSPKGEIAYAKRGKASKKRLIGVQHFKDPRKRLLAFSKEAEKGYYFYSVGKKVICTCKKAKPPEEFVRSAIDRVPYRLSKENDRYSCGHERGDKGALHLEWKSADEKFSVCEDCTNSSTNLFNVLSERMLSPDNSKSFSVKSKIGLKCESDCENCKFSDEIPISDELVEKYFNNLSDEELIYEHSKEARSVVEEKYKVFLIGDTCFGKDKEAFLDHIDHQPWEKPALINLLKRTEGAVLEEGTVNELLEKYWQGNESSVLEGIFDEEEAIKEVLSKDIRPREKLRALKDIKQKKEEMKTLPEFKKLPPEAEFADSIARSYKVNGKDEAINRIEGLNLSNTRVKSIAFAFYKVFGRGDSKRWKYEDTEVESGEFLSDHVESLLDADGEEYAKILQDIVKMSGSTSTVVLKDGKKMR